MKAEIVRVGTKFYVEILFVTSYAHHLGKQQGDWIYVDSEQDKVDFYIDQHIKVTDLVITQDMWLASLLVKKVYMYCLKGGTFVTGEQMNTILYS